VISGAPNAGIGVNDLGTVDNVIAGNYIGTDATGARSMPNGNFGIWLDGASSRTLIEDNVIAGNMVDGIGLMGDYNVVIGNLLGTDASGRVALGGSGGVFAYSMTTTQRNRIGGSALGEANVIAGSSASGGSTEISISGAGTENNYVIGNLIGTDASGTTLPQGATPTNPAPVVQIWDGSKRNVVGGSTDAEANLIAGSAGDGVSIGIAGVSYNFVGGNWIGANKDGVAAIANRGNGVAVQAADHSFIMGNHIASNGNAGVLNLSGAATTIRGNEIHGNGTGITVRMLSAPPRTGRLRSDGNVGRGIRVRRLRGRSLLGFR
jgi:titin